MAYFLDLFSPETYEAFGKSRRDISGFRKRHENLAKHVKDGDKLICYMTKLSRWFGVLSVHGKYFVAENPIFYEEADPFVVRFKVTPEIWLPKEKAVPIQDNAIWTRLSFTKKWDKSGSGWTGKLRNSLNKLTDEDGLLLETILRKQAQDGKIYPVEEAAYKKFLTQRIRRLDKAVHVSVPEDEPHSATQKDASLRESHRIQALLAEIGSTMGFHIWLPRADRTSIMKQWKPKQGELLESLPLNYDDTTLRTIEQIDVLWLRGRAIARAFEVEHTTSVYSGILRMADLLALQPNMDIKLHIVAPADRREKVFQEIRRPVFSLLEKGPLADMCFFISYDSLDELVLDKHLPHMSDSVLDDYSEEAD